MRRFFTALAAIILAAAGTSVSTAEARAIPADFPTCTRVPLGDGMYRLYIANPGSVVKGPVQEVRVSQTQFRKRRHGGWVGTVADDPAPAYAWHVVIKSNARLFSERRFSMWVDCSKSR